MKYYSKDPSSLAPSPIRIAFTTSHAESATISPINTFQKISFACVTRLSLSPAVRIITPAMANDIAARGTANLNIRKSMTSLIRSINLSKVQGTVVPLHGTIAANTYTGTSTTNKTEMSAIAGIIFFVISVDAPFIVFIPLEIGSVPLVLRYNTFCLCYYFIKYSHSRAMRFRRFTAAYKI